MTTCSANSEFHGSVFVGNFLKKKMLLAKYPCRDRFVNVVFVLANILPLNRLYIYSDTNYVNINKFIPRIKMPQ